MSLYGYDAGRGDQAGGQPVRSRYPAIPQGKRPTPKLFDLSIDDFDDLDNLSDLDDLNFGKRRAPVSQPLDNARGNTSFQLVSPPRDEKERGARSLSVDEHVPFSSDTVRRPLFSDDEESPKHTESRAPIKLYTPGPHMDTELRDLETPACKPPVHPKTQASTVTTRWRRRGRLGLAKPKRYDAHGSDDSVSGTSPPNSLDFNASTGSTELRPAVFGSTESIDLGARHSLVSLDAHADVEHTFQARGAARSAMSASQETVRTSNEEPNGQLMDVSDVSMASAPRSRPHSPEHNVPVEVRRAVSPLVGRQLASESVEPAGSPKPTWRHDSPRSAKQDVRLSAFGDAMDISTRFQMYEKRVSDMSPQFKSPRERQRALAEHSPEPSSHGSREEIRRPYGSSALRNVDGRSPSEHSPEPNSLGSREDTRRPHGSILRNVDGRSPPERQHRSSELNVPDSREESRHPYSSSSLRNVEWRSPPEQPKPERHYSSPRLSARRTGTGESNFDALRSGTPQQNAGQEVHSGPRSMGAKVEPRVSPFAVPVAETKATLQEQYAVAAAQVAQKHVDVQPRATPSPQEHTSSAPTSQQQSQQRPQPPLPAHMGVDPKRILAVNGRPYQKISISGRGGSSKVYKAMSAKHEIFAIKRVSFSRADVQAIEGYVNEIILLRKFEGNPHIVQLFDAEINKERGLLHMVMEFGETDLASVLKRSGARPLGMNTVRLYWEQMLRAVQTIHEERVVHADLKPANYLLVKGSLKLIDFGIAKAIGNDTTNIHRENQIGTVNYMSPEAIKETNSESGKRMMKLGRASDIWSLGIILYQMCYGRTPFAQLALFRKLASIPDPSFIIPYPKYMAGCQQTGTDLDPNSDASPTYPDGTEKTAVPLDLLRVMRVCLQRDPEKRMTIPDLLVDPLLCPISLDQALPAAMKQMLSLLKRNPRVLDQWDVSDAQNESVLSSLVHALHQQEQNR
ncbi:Dual-specificity kinase, spindle pole body (SPB) duplication and spindle checkpoint function [Coemansia sp. RSA 1878]|nr:Dual-specificity kinase, spindle pole body (SPB) duplication and spindle checkpoint function [Coemansia sp. RSA 1878]